MKRALLEGLISTDNFGLRAGYALGKNMENSEVEKIVDGFLETLAT